MNLLIAPLALCVVGTPDEVTLTVKEAFTSRYVAGKNEPYTPKIGEDYRITVRFEIVGQPASEFQVDLEMGGLRKQLMQPKGGPGMREVSHNFGRLPLDGVIPFRVELDPYGWARGADKVKSPVKPRIPAPVEGGGGIRAAVSPNPGRLRVMGSRIAEGEFEPVPPSKVVEYFEPKKIIGYQQGGIVWKSGGKIDRMALMMGQPATDSWVKMLDSKCQVKIAGVAVHDLKPLAVTADRFWPLWYWEGKSVAKKETLFKQIFTVEARNQRVNAAELRKVKWSQVDALKGLNVFKFYMQPEEVIECNDPVVASFVASGLGPNYRSKMGPYDAARKLFQAVLKHVTYTFPKEGETDLRGHTAKQVIQKKMGDCGSFSILIVACLRNIGIPARTACGGWVGGFPHCWSEFFLPGGWILCDGSAGNSWSETGEFAYCFGNQFDLNARMAFMRGNTFKVGDVYTSWLQGPMYPWVWGTAKIDKWASDWSIEYAPTGDARVRMARPAGSRAVSIRANDDERTGGCRCERHGGFRIDKQTLLKLRLRSKAGS